jgi:GNAT superfamily N-acetyltransferase
LPVQRQSSLQVRLAEQHDIAGILELVGRVYAGMGNYSVGMLIGQINNFPEGQFVAALGDTIVGYCASSRIDEAVALSAHDWETISGNGFGSRHDPTGDWLYGFELAVDPLHRGLRIGKWLYEARRAWLSGSSCAGSRSAGGCRAIVVPAPRSRVPRIIWRRSRAASCAIR